MRDAYRVPGNNVVDLHAALGVYSTQARDLDDVVRQLRHDASGVLRPFLEFAGKGWARLPDSTTPEPSVLDAVVVDRVSGHVKELHVFSDGRVTEADYPTGDQHSQSIVLGVDPRVLSAAPLQVTEMRKYGHWVVQEAARIAPVVHGHRSVGGQCRWWACEGSDIQEGVLDLYRNLARVGTAVSGPGAALSALDGTVDRHMADLPVADVRDPVRPPSGPESGGPRLLS